MAKSNRKKTKNAGMVDIDFTDLAQDGGLTVLRDSTHAKVADRLPYFLPKLDAIVGGGNPFGRMVEIAGAPGSGKSTLTFHIARVAAAMGCIVVLIDVEGAAEPKRLAELGVDTSRVLLKQPDPTNPDDILTVEEVGTTVENTLISFSEKYPDVPIVFIWDSVGQTPSKVQYSKDFGEKNVGAKAQAITQFVEKISPQVAKRKALIIGINQVRADIGGNPMFQQLQVPGGNAWEHYASLRLEVRQSTAIKVKEERIGHEMKVIVRKSRVSPPFTNVNLHLIYKTGIDYEYNIVHMAVEEGIVNTVGRSYEYESLSGQTTKKIRQEFIDHLKTPEGKALRAEITCRVTAAYYPDGHPATDNETLDMRRWDDLKDIDKITETESKMDKQEAEQDELDAIDEEMK
jgi:protein RecA